MFYDNKGRYVKVGDYVRYRSDPKVEFRIGVVSYVWPDQRFQIRFSTGDYCIDKSYHRVEKMDDDEAIICKLQGLM
jgi:hypothetical protein